MPYRPAFPEFSYNLPKIVGLIVRYQKRSRPSDRFIGRISVELFRPLVPIRDDSIHGFANDSVV